jgi:Holliday junction resolvase RusA-like endonuclease
MKVVNFQVEGKPHGKGRARSALRGRFVRHYTPEKTVAYEKQVAMAAREVFQGEPWAGPVQVYLTATFPWPSGTSKAKRSVTSYAAVKPDIDNILKSALDGLNGVLWKDDSQVVLCQALKVRGEIGRINVTVTFLDDGQGPDSYG